MEKKLFLLVIFVLLILVFIKSNLFYNNVDKSFDVYKGLTDGYITNIYVERVSCRKGNCDYKYYYDVNYSVNDENFSSQRVIKTHSAYLSLDIDNGNMVDIYYNLDNPNDFILSFEKDVNNHEKKDSNKVIIWTLVIYLLVYLYNSYFSFNNHRSVLVFA